MYLMTNINRKEELLIYYTLPFNTRNKKNWKYAVSFERFLLVTLRQCLYFTYSVINTVDSGLFENIYKIIRDGIWQRLIVFTTLLLLENQ